MNANKNGRPEAAQKTTHVFDSSETVINMEAGEPADMAANSATAAIALPPFSAIGSAIAEAVSPVEEAPAGGDADGDDKKSQASMLVAFVQERTELFHDLNGEAFATDKTTGETRRLASRPFHDLLVSDFYTASKMSPREQAVREAIGTLSGLARYAGDCHEVNVRVAMHEGAYFLDLGEAGQSRAVKIEAGRWEVVSDLPVRFVRPETLRPLPEPVRGGDLAQLWPLVNIPEDNRLLVLAWLCECLRPDTPFPVLELLGEQGSAKSTTQTVLRRLFDPNACDLRAAPKTAEDIYVSAGVNCLLSFENISHLPAPTQDALCVLATGGGYAKRKLYTDADETVIVFKRPVILNGISAAITAQDLIDRAVSVELPTITVRAETTDLWRSFEANHGRLLGALLDAMAGALARLPTIYLPAEDRPRLVEFARFGMAIAETLGLPGENFMRQFNAGRQECIARTIDASPVASALIEWFEARDKRAVELPIKELMQQVQRHRPANADNWPRSAKGFGDSLRRAAPALRQIGVACRSLGKVGSTVKWLIEARENSSNSSRECRHVVPEHQHDMTTCTTSVPGFSSGTTAADEIEVPA